MRWRDAASLAVVSVRRRAGRSVLTVLAVALATTLLTALVTIAGTAQTKVLSELSRGGPLAGIKVAAAEPDLSQLDNDNARPGPRRDLDDRVRQQIAGLPGVRTVLPIVAAQMVVVAPDPPAIPEVLATLPPARTAPGRSAATTTTLTGPITRPLRPPPPFTETVIGMELNRADQLPVTVLSGRLPNPSSLTEVAVTGGYLERLGLKKEHARAVLGTELVMGAPRVFEEGRVRLRSRWVRVTVVGVVAQIGRASCRERV
jgi:hypothetical protein